MSPRLTTSDSPAPGREPKAFSFGASSHFVDRSGVSSDLLEFCVGGNESIGRFQIKAAEFVERDNFMSRRAE